MPSQHKNPPISLRLPESDRAWVLNRHKETGQPVNAIIAEAVAAFRRSAESGKTTPSGGSATGTTTRKSRQPRARRNQPESASEMAAYFENRK